MQVQLRHHLSWYSCQLHLGYIFMVFMIYDLWFMNSYITYIYIPLATCLKPCPNLPPSLVFESDCVSFTILLLLLLLFDVSILPSRSYTNRLLWVHLLRSGGWSLSRFAIHVATFSQKYGAAPLKRQSLTVGLTWPQLRKTDRVKHYPSCKYSLHALVCYEISDPFRVPYSVLSS